MVHCTSIEAIRTVIKTPASLLLRLRQRSDQEAWARFVDLYTPIISLWIRRRNVQPADAADLLQQVFVVLYRKLPEFRYRENGSFRGWLQTVVRNKCHDHHRRIAHVQIDLVDAIDGKLQTDPAEDSLESEYRELLIARALQLMKVDFQPATWQAFWDLMVEGLPVETVADKYGISANAVYLAKARVLRRLREELDGFLDE